MKKHEAVLILLGVAQLVLVVLGATQFGFERLGRLGKALELWGAVSGANNSYGFFAPNVGGELRARFEIIETGGRTVTASLSEKSNREVDLRLQKIVTEFWETVKDEKLRRSIAASWAAKMLERHPGASTVLVRIDSYDPPEMSDWRQGLRSGWEPFYTAKFVLASARTEGSHE